jgi:DNA-binding GntR family transcriptional regulator
VASLSPADIAEIYEMRLLLETTCVRYAVDNLDVAAATALVSLSLAMDSMADDPEAGAAVRLDFYSRLYSHADRPRMSEAILRLRSQVGRYHRLNPAGHAGHAHVDLRKAIRARDGERAAEVVAAHLVEARDDLLRSLETASA